MKERGFLLVELFFILAFLSLLFLSIMHLFSSTVRKQRENLHQMVAVSIAQSLSAKIKAGIPVKFPVRIKGYLYEKEVIEVGDKTVVFIKAVKGERQWKIPVR